MARLGVVFVASLAGGRGAAGFAMLSTALRRVSSLGAAGTKRGAMAFVGGASTMASTSGGAQSRWASTTVMSAAAQSATAAGTGPSLTVHKKDSVAHPSYEVVEEDFVAEYGATTTLYKHKKSGAEVLSVQIDDDNKV